MGTFIAMNPFRLRLQCLYVYEAPHLTIESFNIILEACPNLRQVILFFVFLNDLITSSLATYLDGPSTARASSRLSELSETTTWRWKYFADRIGSSQPVPRPYLLEQHEEKKEVA